MRITDYTFNDTLSDALFRGLAVESAPAAELEAHEFERGIFQDLDEAGLGPAAEMVDLRAEAARLLRTHRLSGLPALRPHLPSASSALRYNRAEGLFLGGGATYAPGGPWRVDGTAGYAFGAERVSASLSYRRQSVFGGTMSLRGYSNDTYDVGAIRALAPALNTLSAAFLGDDYLDMYYASGGSVSWRNTGAGAWGLLLGVRAERHRSASQSATHAPFDDGEQFRPVHPIDEGVQFAAEATLERRLPDADLAWSGALNVQGGWFEREPFARSTATAALRMRTADHARTLLLRGTTGLAGAAAVQHHYLLGGAGTLPGFGYRRFAGERFALLQGELTQSVFAPWLGVRLVGALGNIGGLDTAAAPAIGAWEVAEMHGLHASAGAGVSLFWDILRIDRYRGLNNGGRWVTQLSASPRFLDIS
jgi:hypothetical protein